MAELLRTRGAYSEEYARMLWCPFSGSPPHGGNRLQANGEAAVPAACTCLTNDCMAWRWLYEDRTTRDDLGYCGLVPRS